jgi:hypothetical protein
MGDHIDNGIADADNVEIGLGHGLAMIAGSPKGVEYRPGSRSGKTPGSASACRAESLIRQFEVVLCNAAGTTCSKSAAGFLLLVETRHEEDCMSQGAHMSSQSTLLKPLVVRCDDSLHLQRVCSGFVRVERSDRRPTNFEAAPGAASG